MVSHPYMTTGKTIALTIQTFVSKVMSLLFNTLPRFVIPFFPRSKCLLISWMQSLSAMILKPKKIKSVTVSIFFPSICHEEMGPDAMILVFWMLSFKPAFSLSSFTLIKRLFSSSSLPAIRVVIICIPEVVDASPRNLDPSLWVIQPSISQDVFCTSVKLTEWQYIALTYFFPILNQSVIPCLVLTAASCHTYRFLKRQVRCLVFPSLEEFSTVCCDPYSQRI